MSMQVMYSSETPEWGTPQEFFDALDAEFKFKLDACASIANAKCEKYYTKADDGLKQPWLSSSWLNPPYGRTIGDWMAKASEEARRGICVVCLVPARVDTRWWFNFALRADEIRFYKGRLKFVALDGVAESAPRSHRPLSFFLVGVAEHGFRS